MGTLIRVLIIWSLASVTWAADVSVSAPAIGSIRDCDGRIRQVFGTPGAFVLGPAAGERSDAMRPAPRGATLERKTLILRRAGGSETRITLSESATRLQSMSAGWVAALPFAIRLTSDGATVYRLPMKACAEGPR